MSKRIYIANAVTGKLNENREWFAEATKKWREAGWNVVSPMEIVPKLDDAPVGSVLYRQAMKIDLLAVMHMVDAIALGPDWLESKGACFEAITALFFGLELYEAESMQRVYIDLEYMFSLRPYEVVMPFGFPINSNAKQRWKQILDAHKRQPFAQNGTTVVDAAELLRNTTQKIIDRNRVANLKGEVQDGTAFLDAMIEMMDESQNQEVRDGSIGLQSGGSITLESARSTPGAAISTADRAWVEPTEPAKGPAIGPRVAKTWLQLLSFAVKKAMSRTKLNKGERTEEGLKYRFGGTHKVRIEQSNLDFVTELENVAEQIAAEVRESFEHLSSFNDYVQLYPTKLTNKPFYELKFYDELVNGVRIEIALPEQNAKEPLELIILWTAEFEAGSTGIVLNSHPPQLPPKPVLSPSKFITFPPAPSIAMPMVSGNNVIMAQGARTEPKPLLNQRPNLEHYKRAANGDYLRTERVVTTDEVFPKS